MEDSMKCRLCYDDLIGKNGFLLFDYNDNTETKLGRKYNTILNTTECCENLSNYCCQDCFSKIEICFNLLLEIKASNEVILHAYQNTFYKKSIDLASQLFLCQECNTTISGMKLFINHHQNHISNKTLNGSKKNIKHIVSNRLKDTLNDKSNICSVNLNENKNSLSDFITNVKNSLNTSELCFNISDDINDGDGDNSSHNTDFLTINLNETSDKFSVLDETEFLENLSDNESNYSSDALYETVKDSEYIQDSEISDVESDLSVCSDNSYKHLVEIVKLELDKSEKEDELYNLKPNVNGKYSCDACNLTFDHKFILRLHLEDNHATLHEFDSATISEQLEVSEDDCNVFLRCCYCKKAVHTLEFKCHLLECREHYASNSTILCQHCGKMCSFKNLSKHMEDHKKLKGWTCKLCGKKFKKKGFFESHLGEHDENKKKVCEVCGKKVLSLSFLSHIMKHQEKGCICKYCGKNFAYNHALKIHMRIHENSKKEVLKTEKKRDKLVCWFCKKEFKCTITLNKHLKENHNTDEIEHDSRFPCSHCEKKFADMFSLKAHLKLIHEMKDEEIARLKSLPVYRYIECNVCNKVFNSENKIRIHMKQDHGLKPFEMEILKKECEKCGKKFASKQNLIHHINGAHLHIKPMTCDICQEKFAKHSSLIYHKLRHSGEKPFQCEFCHKSYRQRNDVIRHLARHVRDKELTLEEASAVNNSPSRLVIKRRIFLKDSSINYRTIVRKNRRKSEVIDMEPILEEEVSEVQEEQMEFNGDYISDMIYVQEMQADENQSENTLEVHTMNAKPIYNEERNTIILSNPDGMKSSVKNINCRYITPQLKQIPAVIVKKQELI